MSCGARAGAPRLPVPVHDRHRGARPPDRDQLCYSTVVDRLIDALKQVEGAYSLVALPDEALIGVRDPLGVRPLILGRLGRTAPAILASRDLRARHRRRRLRARRRARRDRRDQRPGRAQHQAVRQAAARASASSSTSTSPGRTSMVEGTPVYEARKRIGAELARESAGAGRCRGAGAGFRRAGGDGLRAESGIPFELGIIRNHYVGRTFIEPTDHIRHLGVKLKHSANRPVLEGKRVILVDDSIVRGTTSRKIVEMVRAAGAARGAHAHLLAAHHAFLLLRHRHAGARQAAGGALRRGRRWREHHRRRQPGLHLDRRAVSRAGQAGPRPGAARTTATPASPATIRSRSTTWRASRTASFRCSSNWPEVLTPPVRPLTAASRWSPAPRAASAPRRRWNSPAKARIACWSPAPWAGWKSSTTRSRPLGGPATLVPLDVTDGPGIDRLGAALYERFGRLDILLGNAGILGVLTPRRLVDLLLRAGPKGDLFGLRRGGLNLEEAARGTRTGSCSPSIWRLGSIGSSPPPRASGSASTRRSLFEDARLMVARNGDDPGFPLRLIGLRELRSHNSWMHNAPFLMRGGRTHAARVHPDDAERARARRRRALSDQLRARVDRDRL